MTAEDDKRNYLRIRSEQFSLELEGDPAFILETYDTVRQDILRRLIDLIRGGQSSADSAKTMMQSIPAEVQQDVPPLQPDAEAQEQHQQSKANANNYVWVYITHEIYNKVYVVDLPTFSASPLSRFLDGVRLRKLYVNREYQEVLGPLIGTGKTLWSELTKKGREQLANSGK